jgi:hypothetical protein
MTIRMNGALSRRLAGSALAGIIAFAFVPPALAQWMPPPWRFAPPPVAIERSLEAQGYMLTAPLMRRPGVYLADVSAGPAGYQRLIIDSRSGVILERFPAPGRGWGPALASRGDEFGGPPPVAMGEPPASGEFSGAPGPAAPAKSALPGPANIHIPAAISPYDSGEAPGAKPKPKSVSAQRKPPASKPAAPAVSPPLPPPAPREAAKPDGLGPAASQPVEGHDLDQPRIVGAGPPPAAPAAPGSSAEASEKAKVNIVPPALFE